MVEVLYEVKRSDSRKLVPILNFRKRGEEGGRPLEDLAIDNFSSAQIRSGQDRFFPAPRLKVRNFNLLLFQL